MHRRLHRSVSCGTRLSATALVFSLIALPAAAKEDIERWVDGSLSRHVIDTLNEHPRFRNATVRFVVMDGGQPTAVATALELRLRDRLQQRVAGRVETVAALASSTITPTRGAACPPEAQYLIGIDVEVVNRDLVRAEVRALDAVEHSYVPQLALQWQGQLLHQQRLEQRHQASDPEFRGDRSAPYEGSETDLMAADLGRALKCALMRNLSGDYVIAARGEESHLDELGNLTQLVANHLNGLSVLKKVTDDASVNAELRGEAHQVDGELYQYWITLTPLAAETELSPISVSVYAHVPTRYLSAAPQSMPSPLHQTDATLFESLRLVRAPADAQCRTPMHRTRSAFGPAPCWALQVRTQEDAVVFVLNHQQNHGLVRLGDRACRAKTAARIARANQNTTIQLPADWLRDEWAPEQRWHLDPDADTYYAIAVSNDRAARALAAHLDRLPQRCTASLRSGYQGQMLAGWLEQLSAELDAWQPHVAWNAIRIKNVY